MASPNPQRKRPTRPVVIVLLGLWATLTVAGLMSTEAAPESRVMESVCGLLLGNTDEGRQALVSSVWWPPLPVLVRLPFASLSTSSSSPVASVTVSALFGILSVVFLARSLKRRGAGLAGGMIAAMLFVQPGFLTACMDGSNTTLLIALSILAAGGLAGWIHARTTGELLRFSFAAALLLTTAAECWPWLAVAFGILLLDLLARPADPGQREAVLFLALSPVIYMGGLWLLLNWLVMGDWLYCIRSLLTRGPQETAITLEMGPFIPALSVLAIATLISLARRSRAGISLGFLAASPLAIAAGLELSTLPWDEQALLCVITPLALLAIGRVTADATPSRRWLQPLAVTAALMISVPYWLGIHVAPSGHRDAPEEMARVQGIRRHVLERSPYAKVFVCGYESFNLLNSEAGPIFAHSLDFNFNQVKNAYCGHTLFVLVRRPDGRGAMDSIHWQNDNIYALGSRSTLYDGDWGDWRLFEIIEAPRRRVL